MKQRVLAVSAAVAIATLAAGGGYWAGQRSNPTLQPVAAQGEAAKPERKLLFYRNPMGLPDTSPTPKKDSMGMDYIPVYEGEADESAGAANQIRISTEKVQKLGVKTETASRRNLDKIVRAAGRIEADERRLYTIAPKFEGYVERLHVNATGQPVRKGQPLFEVYSPELVSAQREYAIAAEGVRALQAAGGEAQAGMKQLADASLARLRNWDVSDAQIKTLARSGESRRTLTFSSPASGIITEKKAVQGMRFMPGEALYQVADLSAVWVIADVFEQDIGLLRPGAKAEVRIGAYPDQLFQGNIAYVYPTLNAATRTVPVRVELANPGGLLKPGMFAQLELPVAARGAVLTVPVSAVIDSGTRQIVLVQASEGRYEPREVKLGARSDAYVEVLHGVNEGETVVVAANFLIDAESNLKAAISGFSQAAPGKDATTVTTQPGAVSTGHQAEGKVEEVDARSGAISISHGPVASLKWPAMTMEFQVANSALLKQMQPGALISFEFVERGPGEWVVTSVKPTVKPAAKPAVKPAANSAANSAASAHAGH